MLKKVMVDSDKWAVACMAGSFKGVFVHGALHALEAAGFRARAYGASSSSTLPAALAAIGRVRQQDLSIWTECEERLRQAGASMSDAALAGIERCAPVLRQFLFESEAARFCVATSFVRTADAAAMTQGPGARRLGRRLLLDAARQDTTWRDQHLETHLFDTHASSGARRLTAGNLAEVAYATTRMMHAWHLPAFVAGQPYIDATYTCQCPAEEMLSAGDALLVIATEPGVLSRDLFGVEPLLRDYTGRTVATIRPECNLKELGVDFQHATEEGLERAFQAGAQAAERFLGCFD